MSIRNALFATIALMTGAPAWAADPYWSSISTACTPDNLSIQNNRYQSTVDSYVTPQKGNVDPTVLICAVQPNPGASGLPNMLSMTYLDSTGVTNTAHVLAQLIRVNRSTGGRATVAAVNSDSFPATTPTKNQSAAFSHTLNFDMNFYYVRIEIDRAANSQNVRSIGVALE